MVECGSKSNASASEEHTGAFGNPFLAAMVDVNRTLLDQAISVNKEWASFLQRRFNDGVTTSRALMSAQSPENMVKIWSEYVQMTSDDCRDQMRTMMRRSATNTEGLADPVQAETEEDEVVSRR